VDIEIEGIAETGFSRILRGLTERQGLQDVGWDVRG
jgi:hypothetical protein